MSSDRRRNLWFVAIALALVGEFLAAVTAPLSAWSIYLASTAFCFIVVRARNRGALGRCNFKGGAKDRASLLRSATNGFAADRSATAQA